MPTRCLTPDLIDLHPHPADVALAVREGLQRRPRQLPAWLLYDAEGSRLFEAICRQPEYTLTRTETALLEEMAGAIADRLGDGILVEFGAGNARKVRPLLEALRPAAYVPLDISAQHLRASCERLQRQQPQIPIVAICCDFSRLDDLPDHPRLRGRRRLGFFPGSSIGNFSPRQARRLLRQFRQLLGPDGRLLIGIDRPKAVDRLEAAYDDAAGVSAAFARNLLQRLNRDLDGDIDPEQFGYRARWQPEAQRIEMALVSRCDQQVRLAGDHWHFGRGEVLVTEHSHKYTPAAFAALAADGGWSPQHSWSDPDGDVSLVLLQPGRLGEGDGGAA
jgi:dimethylhistidine N-methyltransferase